MNPLFSRLSHMDEHLLTMGSPEVITLCGSKTWNNKSPSLTKLSERERDVTHTKAKKGGDLLLPATV